MAIIIASTEPRTLAPAFIAHAHSTELSSLDSALFSALRPAEDPLSARKPVGNGIPMASPTGTNNAQLMISRHENGNPTHAARTCGSTNTVVNKRRMTIVSGIHAIAGLGSKRLESRLPMPLDNISRKITTVSA